jgi:channel protein (hemolysin III family)
MEYIDAYPIPGFREPVSCFTHLLAALVFAILSFYLVRRGRGDRSRTLSLTVMACSTLFLLSMSAVYHLLGPGTGRNVMRQLDIAGVFALIAGTVTPVHAILFKGFNRWAPLLLVWSAAATGITLRTVFSESLPSAVGLAIFLLLGWGGLISCILLWRRYGFSFVRPLLWGGVAYTLGVIVLGLNWPILIPHVVGAHEVWHVAVLIGLGLHWKFVFQFAHGPPGTDAERDGGVSPPELRRDAAAT